MTRIARACLLAASLLAAMPAMGQSVPGNLTPNKPSELRAMLLEEGYRAKLSSDDQGDPMITSATAGYDFDIVFYDCTDNLDCQSIQFTAGFTDTDHGTVEDMNAWNKSKRYARAHRDDNGDVYIQMDLSMTREGLGKDRFQENLALWGHLLSDFTSYIWD
jgi:hypothetical protein